MEPTPSGDVRAIRIRARCARPRIVRARTHRRWRGGRGRRARPYGRWRFRATDPMPSGAADLQRVNDRVHAAATGSAGAAQSHHLGRIEAVGEAGAAAALAARGRARAGAEAAMHPAAAILHGRLAAGAAAAGAGAAAGRGQEVARTGAVAEPAAAVRRQAGGRGEGRKGATFFARRSGLCEGGRSPCQAVEGVAAGAIIASLVTRSSLL